MFKLEKTNAEITRLEKLLQTLKNDLKDVEKSRQCYLRAVRGDEDMAPRDADNYEALNTTRRELEKKIKEDSEQLEHYRKQVTFVPTLQPLLRFALLKSDALPTQIPTFPATLEDLICEYTAGPWLRP
jgi:hypothetical protein